MKKIIAMLLAAAMVSSFSACGSSASNAPANKEADKTTETASASEETKEEAVSEIDGIKVDGRLADIIDRGVLQVATEPYFAPYEFIDPTMSGAEQYVGCDIEIAKAIAEKIGVELELVPLEFSAVLASVTEGKYDLCISAIAYSPVREEAMNLSKGYHFDKDDQGYGLVCRTEDAGKYDTIESLKDIVVCTQSGSVQESLFNEFITKDGCQELKLFSAMTDAYLALQEGKADVCVCAIASAKLYAEANAGVLTVCDFKFDSDPEMGSTRVGAPKENTESLIEVVNLVIDELRAEEKIDFWYDEYEVYAKGLGIE